MRRQHGAHRDLQSKTHQFDVFALPASVGMASVPTWRTLPAATRQTLAKLMVRLILEHTHKDCRSRQVEAPDDH